MDYEILYPIVVSFAAGFLFSLAHMRTYKANIRHLQDALDSREQLLAERSKEERGNLQAVLERLEVFTKEQNSGSAGYVDRSKKRVAELIKKKHLAEENERQWNTAIEQDN